MSNISQNLNNIYKYIIYYVHVNKLSNEILTTHLHSYIKLILILNELFFFTIKKCKSAKV